MKTISLLSVLMVLACAPALAQPSQPTALPAWDQLTAAQRETLVAPLRERWNTEPEQRARMLRHSQRWKAMTPEQRRAAHSGMRRFQGMSPQHRTEAKALFDTMRSLPPAERVRLRQQWKQMTPQQRREWVQAQARAAPAATQP